MFYSFHLEFFFFDSSCFLSTFCNFFLLNWNRIWGCSWNHQCYYYIIFDLIGVNHRQSMTIFPYLNLLRSKRQQCIYWHSVFIFPSLVLSLKSHSSEKYSRILFKSILILAPSLKETRSPRTHLSFSVFGPTS